MRMKPLLTFLALTLVLVVAACVPATPGPLRATPDADSTPGAGQDDGTSAGNNIPQTGGDVTIEEQVRNQVTQFLAAQLNAAANSVESLSLEYAEWSDSCLGLGGPAESCLAVQTPGWRVSATVDGQDYVLRTNQDASVIRLEPTGAAQDGAGTGTDGAGTGTGADGSSTIDEDSLGTDDPGTGVDVTGDGVDGEASPTGGNPGADSTTGSGNTASSGLDVGGDGLTGTDRSGAGQSGTGTGGTGQVPATGDGLVIFLIREGDSGESGQLLEACGDSLVPVPSEVTLQEGDVANAIRESYNRLLGLDEQELSDMNLSSALQNSDLRLESVSVNQNGVAVIRFFGDLELVDPDCDPGRARYQLEQVAQQFEEVNEARIYINDRAIDDVLPGTSLVPDQMQD